jgi:hypothetical protein
MLTPAPDGVEQSDIDGVCELQSTMFNGARRASRPITQQPDPRHILGPELLEEQHIAMLIALVRTCGRHAYLSNMDHRNSRS